MPDNKTNHVDGQVKLWQLPEEMPHQLCNPAATVCSLDKRVETLQWHPLASGVLAVTASSTLSVQDVEAQVEVYGEYHIRGIHRVCVLEKLCV